MDGSDAAQTLTSAGTKSMRVEDWLTYVVVVILLASAVYRLEVTIAQSERLFARGIALLERAAQLRAVEPVLASQQVLSISLAHEVVTFKATALFLGAIISVLGALFVLRAGQVAYRASLEGAGWKLGLGTSSPGLVMITLGCALISVAVLARASFENKVPVPTSANSGTSDDMADRIQRHKEVLKLHAASPTSTPAEKTDD
ncbi:MAG TPA: hypothetical protein VFG30_08090 [Polyangiales bacterium]|jgi:hypothetical protein|nr:hypothetical protein [Polyangiales bacterium]